MRAAPFVLLTLAFAIASCSFYAAADPNAGAPDASVDADGGAGTDAATGVDGSTEDSTLQDGGNVCPAESCQGRASCVLHDFTNGCPGWQLSGDAPPTCTSGALYIDASTTFDSYASVQAPTPDTPYSARVAARISIADWDGGRVVRIRIGAIVHAELRATKLFGGKIELSLCRDATECAAQKLVVEGSSDHLFVFELTSTTQLSIDCKPFASVSSVSPLESNTNLEIAFGKTDAQPISAIVDDVMIAYEAPK